MATDSTESIDLILKAANIIQERTTPAESSSSQDQAESYSEDGQEEQDTDFEEEIDMSGDDDFDASYNNTPTTHNGGHSESLAGNEQGGERSSKSRAAASELTSRSTDSRRRKRRLTSGEDISPETKRRAAITLHNVKERQRRQDLKQAVLRLRNQLRRKTKKPSTISVLRAAQQEITELKNIETAQGEELDAQKKKQSFLTWRLEKLISDYKSGQQSGALARPLSAINMPSGCSSPYFLPHGNIHAPMMLPPHHHSEGAATIPPANTPGYSPVPNLTPLINVNAPLPPPHVFPFSPTHNHMVPLPGSSPHSPFLTMMHSPPTHHVASPFVLPSFPNFGGIGYTGARFLYPTAHSFTLPHGSNYPVVPGTMLNPSPRHGPPAFKSNLPLPVPLPVPMHHREENGHSAALDNSDPPRLDSEENPRHGCSETTEQHQNEHVHYVHSSKNGTGLLNDHNVNWTRSVQHPYRNLETGHRPVGDSSEEEEELVVDDDAKSPKGREDSISYPSGGCDDSATEDTDTQTEQTNGADLSYSCTEVLTKESRSSSYDRHPSVITRCPKNFSVAPALMKRVGADPGTALVTKIIEEVRPQRKRISQDIVEGVLTEKHEAFTILNKNRSMYASGEEWYSSEAVRQVGKTKGKKNGLKNSSLNVAHCAVNVRTSAAIVCS